MALCLASSLVEQREFDPRDQMERYCRWYEDGYWSSTGRCFDIGRTTADALRRYRQTGDAFAGSTHPRSAGNGSIMRLAPVPMFFFPDAAVSAHHAAASSRTTHGATECVDACRLFARLLVRALAGEPKPSVLLADAGTFVGEASIEALSRGAYREKAEGHVRGTDYVVDSLQAALWCFARTDSYESAVLRAVNLGDDADTTAAVCGQLAGAYYGQQSIPERWLARLARRLEITALADALQREGAGGGQRRRLPRQHRDE